MFATTPSVARLPITLWYPSWIPVPNPVERGLGAIPEPFTKFRASSEKIGNTRPISYNEVVSCFVVAAESGVDSVSCAKSEAQANNETSERMIVFFMIFSLKVFLKKVF